MVRLVVAFVVLVLAVSGCSKAVSGSAVPNAEAAEEARRPLMAEKALGEFASINYCSLLDTTPLPADFGAMVLAPKPTYEYCRFKVRAGGDDVEIRVGYLDNSETIEGAQRTEDRSKTPPRGLVIQRGEEDDHACIRYLRFADDIWLTIGATTESRKGDWCKIADATIDAVIRRVIAKQVTHFSFGDKSIGKLDACDLVPANVVNAKIGVEKGTAQRFPTGHACYWTGKSAADPIARLFLGAGESSYDPDNTKEETLAGRPTSVTPLETDGEYSACDVETSHIKSPELGGEELIVVEVDLEGDGKDACAPAREIAKEIWAKLPAA